MVKKADLLARIELLEHHVEVLLRERMALKRIAPLHTADFHKLTDGGALLAKDSESRVLNPGPPGVVSGVVTHPEIPASISGLVNPADVIQRLAEQRERTASAEHRGEAEKFFGRPVSPTIPHETGVYRPEGGG